MRLAANVLAKALLADCVVLETVLPLVFSDDLEINEFQLINILLASPHQIQKLVDMVHSSEH
jgi:hypothetical protein